jgi:hypothetical protein
MKHWGNDKRERDRALPSCDKKYIHGFGTRYDKDFHLPSVKLKLFQKGVFYSGIKTYSHLPKTIKEPSHDVKQFRLALNRFIISNSFYSLEEYFDINRK